MRFPVRKPSVGTHVPPNAADVAAGLVVEWRSPAPHFAVAHYMEGGLLIDLWAHDDGTALVRDARSGQTIGTPCGKGAALDEAKRAAVLTLATHLSDTLKKAADVGCSAAGAVEVEMARLVDEVKASERATPIVPAPTPAVPSKGGFKVGDRVRVTASRYETIRVGDVGVVDAVDVRFVVVRGGSRSFSLNFSADEIEHVK